MNKYFLKIASLFLIFSLVSCQNKSGNSGKHEKLATMNWLIGYWENKMPDGDLSENWKKKDDSTFVGNSYFIKGKDTISSESIELTQKGEELYYIPTVKGQNNNKAVSFKLTAATTKEFIFENPKHDYPQKIVYKLINATNLVATISGIQQGKPSNDSFSMTKK